MEHIFSPRSTTSFSAASILKKIRTWTVVAITTATMFATIGVTTVLAQPATLRGDVTGQLDSAGTNIYGANSSKSLPLIVSNIIRGLLGLLGVIAVILIIYAGILWMTAQGEEDKVEKAKDILKQAVIGLIIIFLAYGITTFVINAIVVTSGATSP